MIFILFLAITLFRSHKTLFTATHDFQLANVEKIFFPTNILQFFVSNLYYIRLPFLLSWYGISSFLSNFGRN
jgi:hypothetical protein